jgi:hypothetical protein
LVGLVKVPSSLAGGEGTLVCQRQFLNVRCLVKMSGATRRPKVADLGGRAPSRKNAT